MRKTMLLAGAAALAVVLWLPRAVEANCGHCDKDKGACLCQIEGAEKTVTNTADGVTIAFTAKDPAVVKKIQDAAAKMKEGCGKCKAGCKCPGCMKKAKAKCTGKPDCKCPHCAKKGGKN